MKDLTRFPTATKLKAKSFKASLRHARRQHEKQDLRVLTQEALEELNSSFSCGVDNSGRFPTYFERRDYAL